MNNTKENEQRSIAMTYSTMRGDGTSMTKAILRVANLARSYGWTEQEIEEFIEAFMTSTMQEIEEFIEAFMTSTIVPGSARSTK